MALIVIIVLYCSFYRNRFVPRFGTSTSITSYGSNHNLLHQIAIHIGPKSSIGQIHLNKITSTIIPFYPHVISSLYPHDLTIFRYPHVTVGLELPPIPHGQIPPWLFYSYRKNHVTLPFCSVTCYNHVIYCYIVRSSIYPQVFPVESSIWGGEFLHACRAASPGSSVVTEVTVPVRRGVWVVLVRKRWGISSGKMGIIGNLTHKTIENLGESWGIMESNTSKSPFISLELWWTVFFLLPQIQQLQNCDAWRLNNTDLEILEIDQKWHCNNQT